MGKMIIMQTGKDSLNSKKTYGGDILRRNTQRYSEYGNDVAQGVSNDILYGAFTASWQFRHNVFIEGTVLIRKSESTQIFYNNNSSITSLALRWNIARRNYEF